MNFETIQHCTCRSKNVYHHEFCHNKIDVYKIDYEMSVFISYLASILDSHISPRPPYQPEGRETATSQSACKSVSQSFNIFIDYGHHIVYNWIYINLTRYCQIYIGNSSNEGFIDIRLIFFTFYEGHPLFSWLKAAHMSSDL